MMMSSVGLGDASPLGKDNEFEVKDSEGAKEFRTNEISMKAEDSPAPPRERTYIMVKPDGVQRGLIGNIIGRFEMKGFKLVAMKLAMPGKA